MLSAGELFTGTSGTALRKIAVTAVIPDGFAFEDNIRMTGDSNANAWIDYIEDSTIWYHQDEFTGFTPFRVSENINIGAEPETSPALTRTIDLHDISPGIDRFSGDVFFVSNDAAQPRTDQSTDDIKLVIQL